MGFIYFLIALIIIGPILEKIINKLLRVDKKRLSETPGKKIERWGRAIIGAIYICCVPFFVIADANKVMWFWLSFLILLQGFHAFLEWKYLKNSKQYVSTLIILVICVIFVCIFFRF